MVLWDEIATETASKWPEVKMEKILVDAMTTRMVLKPESIDTIVATNLVSSLINLDKLTCGLIKNSMQTFFLILQLLWLDQLALRRLVTSTLQERILPCLSQFMDLRLILLGWALVSIDLSY